MNSTSTDDENDSAREKVIRKPKLLLVDDQPINIQVLYQIFSVDHEVFMATSGAQALTVCKNQMPDLILLDIEMPDMNGYEVCKKLKADPNTYDIPVIFVTGHSDPEAEACGLDIGAVDFISKPVNPKIVRARVKTHITLKEQSDLLRSWVYIDGLTSVHNRRYFDERLAIEWGRASRYNTCLSLILIDIDFFKRYNDLYGHIAGDDCLRNIATTLNTEMKRFGDLFARYGGEEFVCLLPNTDLNGAITFAEQLRLKVSSLGIKHLDSAASPHLSISLGICTKNENTKGLASELLKIADDQLYKAKLLGRNQTCGIALSSEA